MHTDDVSEVHRGVALTKMSQCVRSVAVIGHSAGTSNDPKPLPTAILDSAINDFAWLGTYGTETVALALTRKLFANH